MNSQTLTQDRENVGFVVDDAASQEGASKTIDTVIERGDIWIA
jgi:hypothetical protein